jgi:hypothetical protein
MRRYLFLLVAVTFVTWVIGMATRNYELAVGSLIVQVLAIVALIVLGPPRR